MKKEIRLYAFQCGNLSCWHQWIHLNEPAEERYVIPVPFFVVTHPDGNVIIDGGNAPAAAVDHVKHWGTEATGERGMTAHMDPEDACIRQLKRAGIPPGDFKYIVQTHLHADHDGALASYDDFPTPPEVVVSRLEWEYARTPEWPHRYDFVRADIDRPDFRLNLLEKEDDGYDLHGDGTVRLWHTPGHTPGHMSVEAQLPESGSVLMTGDAVYTEDHWLERSLPGSLVSTIEVVRSVQKLRRIATRDKSMVIYGHDPEQYPNIKKAPDFYA
jgi:N-acyl homoserine lactone hydrolase